MRKSIVLIGCPLFLGTLMFHAPQAEAFGIDNFISFTVAQAGAPQGGMTGSGGDAGVGDHDAGMDRTQSYNVPIDARPSDQASPNNSVNSGPANSTTSSSPSSPLSDTTTTDDQRRGHSRRHNSGVTPSSETGAGNGMPRSGNSY